MLKLLVKHYYDEIIMTIIYGDGSDCYVASSSLAAILLIVPCLVYSTLPSGLFLVLLRTTPESFCRLFLFPNKVLLVSRYGN